MSNHGNYYFNIMSFKLKNACTTYQSLMDAMFLKQIGYNLEVYIDDMIMKTLQGESHTTDLEDIPGLVKIYNMRLNPVK